MVITLVDLNVEIFGTFWCATRKLFQEEYKFSRIFYLDFFEKRPTR